MGGAGFAPLPERAGWRHHTARDATEVVAFSAGPGAGWTLSGVVTGVEAGSTWAFAYDVTVDAGWVSRAARVRSVLSDAAEVRLVHDGAGRWEVDGRHRPELDGVLDVDLEASAVTNTLPLHRTGLPVRTAGPAAYVRLDLTVERLDQWYGPTEPVAGGWSVPYQAPRFAAELTLLYDRAGLVVDYPGLAERVL